MKVLTSYHFYIVDCDQKTRLRYVGHFIPRVGDTITIGEYALKVVDVVIESAQMSGEGFQHSLYVHVHKTNPPLIGEDCEDLDFDGFFKRLKQ